MFCWCGLKLPSPHKTPYSCIPFSLSCHCCVQTVIFHYCPPILWCVNHLNQLLSLTHFQPTSVTVLTFFTVGGGNSGKLATSTCAHMLPRLVIHVRIFIETMLVLESLLTSRSPLKLHPLHKAIITCFSVTRKLPLWYNLEVISSCIPFPMTLTTSGRCLAL